MCKLSVTHGGVFTALQSSRHAHILLSFFPSLPPSLSDLLLRLDDQEWEVLSRKRTVTSLAQPCLMFHAESVAAPFFTQGMRTELVTQAQGGSRLKVSAIWEDTLCLPGGTVDANIQHTRKLTPPSSPGGPGSPFWPGGPMSPSGPGSPCRPLSPWTPLSPEIPGSPWSPDIT